MHEMALMAGVFDIISQHTATIPNKKVSVVTLVVGEMTNAVPEALEAAFEVLSQGTNAEGARLEIRIIPLMAACSECGWEGKTEKFNFICPKCSGLLEIKSGRELYVDSLEVD